MQLRRKMQVKRSRRRALSVGCDQWSLLIASVHLGAGSIEARNRQGVLCNGSDTLFFGLHLGHAFFRVPCQ